MIVTALATGAVSALQDGATDAVKTAYTRLKDAALRRLHGQPDGELVLIKHELEPEKWQAMLAGELSAVGAGTDDWLIQTARALLELVDAAGARAGKYQVTVTGSQGVQVGDHNTQTNTFGAGPA
jgi:hypothetical protein